MTPSLAAKLSWANPEHRARRVAAMRRAWDDPLTIAAVRKSHCKRGHEFTEINTYISAEGWQVCRRCAAMKQKLYRDRRKALDIVNDHD